ncbi:Copia protein [Cucumis melo var. makuwa]|uniref:Copia protein n=1 Tax=Cucumis melo var. makuwa TaxID=1194695 RepID=A0A5A7T406_CUCMM|nr:Copia protein [Cucumis melo var. makuwa]
MDDHMTEDAPEDAKKKDWLRDDARLYLQIKNSIGTKEQVHRMFEVCMQFLRAEQKAESVTNYFMRLKKITAELALLLPFSPDVKAQILSDSKIPSLDNAFTRVLCFESSPNGVSIPQSSTSLISKNNNPRAPRAMDGNVHTKSYDHRKPDSTEIVCNYCRKPSHRKRDCRKLLYKNSQQSQHAQIASTCDIPEASITISANECAKLQNYQDSLQASSSSTPIASTVVPGNTKCLLTSSTKWDRVTKKIIGKGYESGGLYLFDHQVSQAVACPVIPSPFEPDVAFLEDTPFTSSPSSSCEGEDDNLFIYEITLPTNAPPSRPLPSRVYSRQPPSQPSDSCPTSMPPSSCDLGPSDDLPIALRKALSHPGWRNAMIEEMTALYDNGTWDLVSRPIGKKAIGCKWVFSLKVNTNGTVPRSKARLVAKDYAQTYGIDYSDTFSLVVKLTSIRLFLSMAATHNWSLHQLNIKNVFLHGDLQEKVYLEQPPSSSKIFVWFETESKCVVCGNDALGISSLKTFLQVDHWAVVEQILCYSKAAPGRGILYRDHGYTRVECFSDADWAGSRKDKRSTSGYCVFVGENLVPWKSKKQNVISRSSAESEYRAMTQSVCAIVWIHQLLSETCFSITVPAKLWCDNQVALHIASNPVFHEQTKNVEVDCHFIREKIQDGLVSTGYVKTGEKLGDILTKAVNGARISYLCNKLDMIDIFAPA